MAETHARFWVYAHEHVVGPYDAEEIQRLPVFGADLPLCAEELLGTPEELWRRAADVAPLARVFPPSQRTPAGQVPPKVGPWPPDVDKEAVDPLGTAQARMDIIDQSLAATQRRLELRREGYDRLKRELVARVTEAKELEDKIRMMGVRMSAFLGVKEEMDKTHAALLMSNRRADGLEENLATEAKGLKEQIDQTRASLVVSNRRAAELEESLARVEVQLKEAAALAAEAAKAARRLPKARPGQAPAAAPAKPGRRERRPRPAEGGADLGLPPATSVDVPDFT